MNFIPKRPRFLGSLCAAALLNLLFPQSHATETFFVSPQGNDHWSGRASAPSSLHHNGPFASLQRAQQAVRERNADASREQEDIRIVLRGGTYTLQDSLTFDQRDAGAAFAPVEWTSYPGENVLITGGVQLNGARPLSSTHLTHKIPESAVPHVWVFDLHAQGIENFGTLQRRGFQIPFSPSALKLYNDGSPMTLARYPNEDWVRVADVPQESGEPFNAGHHDDRRYDNVPTGRHYGAIEYEGERPARWLFDHDIWTHGYWTWDWADSSERIQKVDTKRHRIDFAPPYHSYGITKGQRYFYYNIPEELDAPGEWYLDRERGLLFFWPPENSTAPTPYVSLLDKPLLHIEDSAYLRFSGLNFAYNRAQGIEIINSSHVEIAESHFHALAGIAVTINGGHDCGVRDSHFEQIDAGGVTLAGGDRATLERGNHYAINNHFHDFGLVYRTNNPAIYVEGVGQRAANNLIHDAPHMALFFKGNDHLIEYNEIHHIAKETGDVGAIYIGRDYTSRGTIVRFNYLHDLIGPGLHGVRGVYLDDFSSGIAIYGNLFYRAGRAAFVGGGRDNLIQNNVFVDCEPSIQIDGRGLSWAVHHFDQNHPKYASTLRDRMADAKVDQPPYSTRYPKLKTLYQDEPRVPKYNVIQNNVSTEGVFLDFFDGVDTDLVQVSGNLIAGPVALRMTEKSDQSPEFTVYRHDDPATEKVLKDNILFTPTPDFFRLEGDRPQIDFDSLPAGSGFVPLPLDKIGLLPTTATR